MITVTGATGFIAAHVIDQLAERGEPVRATVRSVAKSREQFARVPNLELCEADLLGGSAAFDFAVQGARCVMHLASPYLVTVKDPQKDLVDPAVRGTLSVLEACARQPSVRRVVVTSSMAAITDEPDSNHLLTEADWNTRSSLARNPYYFSKAEAERAAWKFMTDTNPHFDLVVINPFFVIGPSLTPGLNASNQILADIVKGVYPGILSLAWGFVDVRDVAAAHIRAMDTPTASGRYLCAAEVLTMRETLAILRESVQSKTAKIPSLGLDSPVGTAIVQLLSYAQPSGVGSYLRTHLGRTPRFDNGKIRKELGLAFRPVRGSIRETVQDLVRWGHLPG